MDYVVKKENLEHKVWESCEFQKIMNQTQDKSQHSKIHKPGDSLQEDFLGATQKLQTNREATATHQRLIFIDIEHISFILLDYIIK
jgi:hypothetical protein